MHEEDDVIIDISNLHKYFSSLHILKGIDFKVKAGQLISIIGRSGCGKTTFLRCLNCLEILDEGRVRIAGVTLNRNPQKKKDRRNGFQKSARHIKKITGIPFKDEDQVMDEEFKFKANAIRKRVGMLFQNFNLFPHLTVLDNVMLAPKIVKKESTDQATLRALGLLEKVGMEEFADRLPHQLSGGQAQRVAIARSLALSPQVMLYDEPTSALDPELVEEVLEVMRNLHREGMTQVIVTHAMGFARNASDLVVYMEDGKIVEVLPPDELFTNPKDERTRMYLNSVID